MSKLAVIDRKQIINERYWMFSVTELENAGRAFREIAFPESIREVADSLGVRVETLKYHVEPRTLTLPVRCYRCAKVSDVTRIYSTRYQLESLYSCSYTCHECQTEEEHKQAEDLAGFNETLREKYGPLIVRECPNCGWLTHITFDPVSVEFYEICENGRPVYEEDSEAHEGKPCFTSLLNPKSRKVFLLKIIALLQAKAALS